MKIGKVLLSGLAATSLMTLFSYAVSGSKKDNFKEPELLGALEKELLPAPIKSYTVAAGWITHYSIGVVWAAVYEILWQKTGIKPTVRTGLILGGISGLIGIIIWRESFTLHPHPPKIDYRNFYVQLLFAHFIYGSTAAISAQLDK